MDSNEAKEGGAMSRILLILGATLLAYGCSEADVDLGNGYRYVELSRGTGAIVDRHGDFVVYPNVTDYRKINGLVVGRRVLATNNIDGNDSRFTTGLGQYMLNTETGEVKLDVSAEDVARASR